MSEKSLARLIEMVFMTRHMVLEHAMKRRQASVSLPQLESLRYVAETPHCTMRQIAAHFGITPPSATSLVAALAKEGWVERIPDERDRRVIRIRVTAAGRNILKNEFRDITERMKVVFGHLPDRDQLELTRILEKLAQAYKH